MFTMTFRFASPPALIFAATLAFLVACTGAPPTAQPPTGTTGPATAPAAERPSGTLRIGMDAWAPTLAPWVRGSTQPWGRPYQQIYDALTVITKDGKSEVGNLAESWRNVDPLTWEFVLKPTARFHDGRPVTSADVEFSVGYVVATPTAQVTTQLKRLQTRVVDERTIQIITPAPNPVLPRLMTLLEILPKHYWEAVGGEGPFGAKPIGTGPFQVAEFREQELVRLRAFEGGVRGTPRLAEVVFLNMLDAGVRTAALRTGEIDIAISPSPGQESVLQQAGAQVKQYPNIGAYRYLIGAEQTAFRDKRLRQAMNYAVNKPRMIEAAFGGVGVPLRGQILREGFIGYNPNVDPYEYNPTRARQLIAAAGGPPTVRMPLKFVPFGAGFAEATQIIQADLAAVGIQTEIVVMEFGAYFGEVQTPARRHGAYIIAGGSSDLDGLQDLLGQLSTDPRKYYENPEFDRVVLEAAREFDLRKREQLLQQAIAIMNDDPPMIFMHGAQWVYGLGPKVVDFDQAWFPNGLYWLDRVAVRP